MGAPNAGHVSVLRRGRLYDKQGDCNRQQGGTVDEKAGVDGKSSKGVAEPVLQPGPQNRWGCEGLNSVTLSMWSLNSSQSICRPADEPGP